MEKKQRMSSELSEKKCSSCEDRTPPLKGNDLEDRSVTPDEGWTAVEEHHLMKRYAFDNFKQALAFTNRVGDVAEEQGHHPDISLSYGKVEIKIWTHKIDGLTERDFIFAGKVDAVL